MTYNLSCRLFTDAKCFGPGVAQLLHAVQELHSLRAAALSMDMAYSKAWTIIKNSEKALGFSLLDSTTGGKGGGGAALTPRLRHVLRPAARCGGRAVSGGVCPLPLIPSSFAI